MNSASVVVHSAAIAAAAAAAALEEVEADDVVVEPVVPQQTALPRCKSAWVHCMRAVDERAASECCWTALTACNMAAPLKSGKV